MGILELNDLLYGEIKSKIWCEYFCRLKRVEKSKLNGKNVIIAANMWAVSVLSYGAGLINWTKLELVDMKEDQEANDHLWHAAPASGCRPLIPS